MGENSCIELKYAPRDCEYFVCGDCLISVNDRSCGTDKDKCDVYFYHKRATELIEKDTIFCDKKILDACCGSKMFWFNKKHRDTLYMDIRTHPPELLSNGSVLMVEPDVIADYRNMPFDDDSFFMVIFDPPHLLYPGKNSFMFKKYGKLNKTWKQDLAQGFSECFRVLRPAGTLIFKWSEHDIKLSELLDLTPEKPLITHKKDRTYFVVFMKL